MHHLVRGLAGTRSLLLARSSSSTGALGGVARLPWRLPSLAPPLRPLAPPLLPLMRTRSLVSQNVPKSKRFELSVAPGTTPHAALKSYKPTSPGRRHRVIIDKSHLWPGRPMKSLTARIKSHAGRNHYGRITIRGRSAPKHRRLYRSVDFHRRRTDPAIVQRFEYDPNRTAFIALIRYECVPSAKLHAWA